MNDTEVFYLIDHHLDAEYDFVSSSDLANVDFRVDSQQRHIRDLEISVANLTDRNNQLVDVVCTMAEAQGMKVRVEE